MRDKRRYVYFVDRRRMHKSDQHAYRVERVERGDYDPDGHTRSDVLTVCGHWMPDETDPPVWGFESARAADDMVRRLNAGLPLHRERWVIGGAAVLIGLEVAQTVAAF